MYEEKCQQHPLFFAIDIVIVLKVLKNLLSLDDILARNCCGVLDQNKLKVTAIDSIENMDPPEDCVNIAKWRENKLEQLEEYYKTLLCTYSPHGMNVRGQGNYKKWTVPQPGANG